MSNTYWNVDDGNGNSLTQGLENEVVARRAAQRMVDQKKLSRAAKHVGAVTIGHDKLAHYDSAMDRWYVVSSAELAELADYLDDPDPQISSDAYSHWCAGTTGKEMPEGWNPR